MLEDRASSDPRRLPDPDADRKVISAIVARSRAREDAKAAALAAEAEARPRRARLVRQAKTAVLVAILVGLAVFNYLRYT